MPKEIDRRKVIAGIGGGIVLLGIGDVTYARRWTLPSYELSSDILSVLNTTALTLQPKITQEELAPIKVNGKVYDVQINKNTIARTLLYFAYLDGGMTEVNNVAGFIQDKGLTFSEDTKLGGDEMIPSDGNNPVEVSVGFDTLETYAKGDTSVDANLWHEFYHVIQQARNPNLFDKATIARVGARLILPPALGLAFGIRNYRSSLEKDTYFSRKLHRRKLFTHAVAAIKSVPVFMGVAGGTFIGVFAGGEFIDPAELQANTEAGGLGPNGLLAVKLPENIKGQLFTFTEKN